MLISFSVSPSTGTGSVSVSATTTGTHPQAVRLKATATGGFAVAEAVGAANPAFSAIEYVWTLTEGSLGTHDVPNILTPWRDATVAYGKFVCFVIPNANQTISGYVFAIDRTGIIARTSFTYTSGDADVLFEGASTICLDPSGVFSGAPTGATQVTSVSAMQSALNARSAATRILVARGSDLEFAVNDFQGEHLRYVGAFGSGDRPILRHSDTSFMFDLYQTAASDVLLVDLDCRGEWESDTETGRPTPFLRMFQSTANGFLMHNCRVSGFVMVNTTIRDTGNCMVTLSGSEITNYQDYGIFNAGNVDQIHNIVGCDIAQHVQALNDYQNERDGMSIMQGPIRMATALEAYFGASSFLSRGGWSGGNDQPCLRLNSAMGSDFSAVIDRVTLEGGSVVAQTTGANSSVQELPGNILADRLLLLNGGGKTGREAFFVHMGGSTFRNVLHVQLDVPSAASITWNQALHLTPNVSYAPNLAAAVEVYNSTTINMRSAANDLGDSVALTNGDGTFTNVTRSHNVEHGPNLDTPVDGGVSTSETLPGFTPRYGGIRPNFPFETGTLGSNVGNGASFTLPYPSGTNQAYWQGLPASDNRHMLWIDTTSAGKRNYYAAYDSLFSVAYEASAVRITNNSTHTWTGSYKLRLDRRSQLPGFTAGTGNPATVPLPRPSAGGADTGVRAYSDFLMNVRPGPSETGQDHTGAPRPTTGNSAGAVLA